MTEPSYTPLAWADSPDTSTPIDAANLAHVENGVKAATDRAVASVRHDQAQSLPAANQAIGRGNIGLGDIATHPSSDFTFSPALTEQVLYVTPRGNDSNDGRTLNTAKATIGAVQSAVASSGAVRVVLGYGRHTAQSFQVDRDGLVIDGCGRYFSTIPYTSAGAAVSNSDPTQVRHGLKVTGVTFDLSAAAAGSVGIQYDNFYRAVFSDVWVNQLGVNGTALKIVGSSTKSSYFGRFADVDLTSGGTCVDIGDNCNGHSFFGGVYDGTGVAINAKPTAAVSGECRWFGTAIQTSGSVTAQIGGGGQLVNSFEWHGIRVETGVSGAWNLATGSAKTCLIVGGSWSGATINRDLGDRHTIIVPQLDKLEFRVTSDTTDPMFPGILTSGSEITAGLGLANSCKLAQNTLQALGTGTNVNLELISKGTGAVRVNANAGNGTGFFGVYSAGTLAHVLQSYGTIDSFPTSTNPAYRVTKSGESGNRLKIANTGDLQWGDGTNAADTTLARAAAGVLALNGPIRLYAAATTSRPSASTVGAGAQMFDTTLGKPIWSNGTAWVDATGTAV